MIQPQTLNEISRLEQCRFGRPSPRHGLKLLYWFANDFLLFDINNEMVSKCYPEYGEFGFHLFENRYERNGVKLLPDVDLPYYVVGNLNKPQSYNLPHYVREEYTGVRDNSNMDRIIVRMDNEWVDKVYVTEHSDRYKYNSHATYCISKGLLKIIRGLNLFDFLWRTGFWRKPDCNVQIPVEIFRNTPKYTPRVNQMTIALMPANSSERNQDTCIEIKPQNDSQNDSLNDSQNDSQNDSLNHSQNDSLNDSASISMNTSKRKRCCECTIL